MEHINDKNCDIVFLTETWLPTMKNFITASCSDYNYKLYHVPRKGRKKVIGGGVGILSKNVLEVKPINVKQFVTIEFSIDINPDMLLPRLSKFPIFQFRFCSSNQMAFLPVR